MGFSGHLPTHLALNPTYLTKSRSSLKASVILVTVVLSLNTTNIGKGLSVISLKAARYLWSVFAQIFPILNPVTS